MLISHGFVVIFLTSDFLFVSQNLAGDDPISNKPKWLHISHRRGLRRLTAGQVIRKTRVHERLQPPIEIIISHLPS